MDEPVNLASRFIKLPLEKRRLFLDGLRKEGIDFSVFPIPANVDTEDRDIPSYSQQRMWMLWQLNPQGSAYNLPGAVRLKGSLNKSALENALDGLAARHETLRSVFQMQADGSLKVLPSAKTVAIERQDFSALPDTERKQKLRQEAAYFSSQPFDLADVPPLRAKLLKLAEQEHVLLFVLHHIAADGWSMNVLIEEFCSLYAKYDRGDAAQLPPLPIQYRDYALWQRRWLEAGEEDRQLAYWRGALSEECAPLKLPTDYPRTPLASFQGARVEFDIEPQLAQALRELAKRHNATLFMVLLAAFQVLLYRYSGQSLIRVGVPVANRNRSEVERIIGCFINTQVLQLHVDPLIDVTELLQRVRDAALGAQAHQDLPIERLVEVLKPERQQGVGSLFQVLFNHHHVVTDVKSIQIVSDLSLERYELEKNTARFELTLDIYESAVSLRAAFTYAVELFTPDSIQMMSKHWTQILKALVSGAKGAIGEISLTLENAPLTAEGILSNGENAFDKVEPASVSTLIAAAAQKYPARIAAVSGDANITYEALNLRADNIAGNLRELGVTADQLIGIVADRSIDMVVNILAVMKSGAAYVPLDPEQPRHRLAFIAEDGDVRFILADAVWKNRLEFIESAQFLCADDLAAPRDREKHTAVPALGSNLAYVIYTSGTTGTPKGVAVSHQALASYVAGVSQKIPLDRIASMAMVSTPAADLGHTVFFGALCSGKTLHLIDRETVMDGDAFASYMARHSIDAIKIVPSHLEAMLSSAQADAGLPAQCLILGGESCTSNLLARVAAIAPELTIINHYGPTETTVGVLTHLCEPGSLKAPPLGHALHGASVFVLDKSLQAVPGAARGELHVAGASVARGYLGRPALTAERFVPNPFDRNGERMYRTGDEVWRNKKHEVVFVGRLDNQIKIRGYRVEPAEIARQIEGVPGVKQALVKTTDASSNAQLAAYIVPDISGALSNMGPLDERAAAELRDKLKDRLKQNLPEYMIPNQWLFLEALPLTANGKVDLKALPAIDCATPESAHVPPSTAVEIQMAAIWSEVLAVANIGLTDNFFALGGHSLLATQVIARARKQFSLDIPMRLLFDSANLQDFTRAIAGLKQENDSAIAVLERTAPLPVSHAQHRQWLFWKMYPQSTAYHTPMAIKISGQLNIAALEAMFSQLIARHETLRTVFIERDGVPLQKILSTANFRIAHEDASAIDENSLKQKISEEIGRLFDLARGPLIRAALFKLKDGEHLLVLTLHHIISDGWSMGVMVREGIEAYNASAAGQLSALAPLTVQYADYASWQREQLAQGQLIQGRFETQLAYWKNQLEDDFSALELPADRIRPLIPTYRGSRLDIQLPTHLTMRLRSLAVKTNSTLFHVFLAAFAILLSRYSDKNTVNIGVPVTNRNRLELETLIGFFVNTLVIRIKLDDAAPFLHLLTSVKTTTLDAQANKDIPFETLVEALQPERDISRNPLFQVMYNHLRDFGGQVTAESMTGLHVQEIDLPESASQFDLSLDTIERSNAVLASFTYSTDLFDGDRIERLANRWVQLLENIADNFSQPVSQLPLINIAEYRQQIRTWNCERTENKNYRNIYEPYGNEACAHEFFEWQVEKTPAAIALICDNERLTYRELNLKANRLAHVLIELGIGPDKLVGISVESWLDMAVGLLAVLKAGGAYVPLDPAYPQERLDYMFADSGIQLLLTHKNSARALLIPDRIQTVFIDAVKSQILSDRNPLLRDKNPLSHVRPENLAYVIYTSGSTGKPKGVSIPHRALANFCIAAHEYSRLTPDDKVLQFATFSFDGFVEQFYPPLCCGATVVMRGTRMWDTQTFYDEVIRQGITLADLPAAYWRLFARDCVEFAPRSYGALRQIHVGGEALPLDGLDNWRAAQLANVRLINTYGPTEATVVSNTFDCADLSADHVPVYGVPIGRPVSGRHTYVLDRDLNPVCSDIVGELFIGNENCLARNYHNRPALTAERFIPNPFDEQGGRLYRTGDLASYRADGVIDYVGRIDHQVKIRGFRIELGEIEARLQEQHSIREAVVVAIDGANGKQLVGYVVPANIALARAEINAEIEAQRNFVDALKLSLKSALPDYMIPALIVLLERLPLTPNGKLDRKALPAPDVSAFQQSYVSPQTNVEKQIATIWQDVLGLQQIGRTDNFFELGGDSIISIQVVSRARHAGIHFTPKDLFQHQTVQGLASVATVGGSGRTVDQTEVVGATPLLPIQTWFFETEIPERQRWNQSLLLKPGVVLNGEYVERALQALVLHHDALRLSFAAPSQEEGDASYRCAYRSCAEQTESWKVSPLLWQTHAANAIALEKLCDEAQGSLDLQQGHLLRAVLATFDDGSQRLLIVAHHLVVDGVSWRILLDDLQTAYKQLEAEESIQLPEKTSALKTWAEQLHTYAGSESLQAEINYWQAQLRDAPEDLPRDRNSGSARKHERTIYTRLDKEFTQQLLQVAPAAYRTQINDLLLTALARTITRWSKTSSVLIELEGHGREELADDIDLSRTVGWFTSVYPVQLHPHDSFDISIKHIKEQLRAIPKKGIGYGVLRYLDESSRKLFSELPQPRITFNYLGQFDASFDDGETLFTPAKEGRGSEQHDDAPIANWLNINGQIYNGELSVGWTFSSEMFDEPTIQSLADCYGDELAELITHCCTVGKAVTPSDFPLAKLTQIQLDALPISPADIEDIYPLSPMQQGMLFHTVYEHEAGDYINQIRVDIDGLDVERFRDAWQAVVDAHDILRTSFIWEGDLPQPMQIVHKRAALSFVVHEAHSSSAISQTHVSRTTIPQEAISQKTVSQKTMAELEWQRGFDLRIAPPIRLVLIHSGNHRYHLIYTTHHILMDGWGTSLLLGEVLSRYARHAVPPSPGRYRDYIEWVAHQDRNSARSFWEKELQTLEKPAHLARALAAEVNHESDNPTYHDHHQHLDINGTRQLNEFSSAHKVTVNTLVQAAWITLLQHYTGLSTVAFGATVSGRPTELKNAEQLIGLFINTLPVIATRTEFSIGDWLRSLQEKNLALRDYEYTPLYEIQSWARLGGETLFDTLLIFENFPVAESLRQGSAIDLTFGEVINREQTNYPLVVGVIPGKSLTLHFRYVSSKYTAEIVNRLALHFERILMALVNSDVGMPAAELLKKSGEVKAQIDQTLAQERRDFLKAHYPIQRRGSRQRRNDLVT